MSFLANAKIRTKVLSLIIPICVIGIGGVLAISNSLSHADKQYTHFIENETNTSINITRSGGSLITSAYAAYQLMSHAPGSSLALEIGKTYAEGEQALFRQLERAKTLTPEHAQQIDRFESRAREIYTLLAKAMQLNTEGRRDEASAILDTADPQISSWRIDLRNWNDTLLAKLAERSDAITQQTSRTIVVTLSTLALLFTAGILLSLLVAYRGITGPIDRLRARMIALVQGQTQAEIEGLGRKDEVGDMAQAVAIFRDSALERGRLQAEAEENRSLSEQQRIQRDAQKAAEAADIKFAVDHLASGLSHLAEGDVCYRIPEPFTASLDSVRNDFNNSAEKLQAALDSVSRNARAIDAGANEIKSAADDLAQRTEQQAAAVEETAAALEQVTITVKDSTRRAQEVGQLVSRTREGAEHSGVVVRRAVMAMEKIEKSSSEIGNIIGVIDEIAFQTNLLALNAGVEAARAGDAGKGFAVVAQEVRELAQRSANAAKEIKALITTSNEQVQEGVQLVGDTGTALETIVTEVQEINRHVGAIVEAAHEQASGLQQINTAVNQMDQDTQKNAAMVEQSTAASHALAGEVTSLNQLLGQFRLGNGRQAPAVRTATRNDQPKHSPARALGRQVAGAFSGKSAVASERGDWQEF